MKRLLRKAVSEDLSSCFRSLDRSFGKLDRIGNDILPYSGKLSLSSACGLALEISINGTRAYSRDYDAAVDELVVKSSRKGDDKRLACSISCKTRLRKESCR